MNFELIIISCRAQQEIFERHLPLWTAVCPNIVVLSGITDFPETRFPILKASKMPGSAGMGGAQRTFALLNHAAHNDFTIAFETDSICLHSELSWGPLRRGLTGIGSFNQPETFMATRYLGPPWILDELSARRMLEKWREYPDVYEEGWMDRLLSALATLAGVPQFNHREPCFTRGTIGPDHYSALDKALAGGAKWFHGVKTKEVLDGILNHDGGNTS